MLSSHRIKMGTKALVYTFKFIVILFVFGAISVGCMGAGAFTGLIETAPDITLNDVTPSQYKTTVYDHMVTRQRLSSLPVPTVSM